MGERSRQEISPYGRRGNGVVRHLGESYDHLVLTGGFSKAYSSLLAFYPGMPREEVGFRIQVTAANTDDEVTELLAALDRLADVVPLRPI
jgi:8-amino-7-oxononanoate synthase